MLETGRTERAVSFQRTVLFDKMRGEDWARRARRADANDTELDIEKESVKVDKDLR